MRSVVISVSVVERTPYKSDPSPHQAQWCNLCLWWEDRLTNVIHHHTKLSDVTHVSVVEGLPQKSDSSPHQAHWYHKLISPDSVDFVFCHALIIISTLKIQYSRHNRKPLNVVTCEDKLHKLGSQLHHTRPQVVCDMNGMPMSGIWPHALYNHLVIFLCHELI